jgi:hypothetical protein
MSCRETSIKVFPERTVLLLEQHYATDGLVVNLIQRSVPPVPQVASLSAIPGTHAIHRTILRKDVGT